MLEAIEQCRRGYTPEADERMTNFQHRYWEVAAEEFPELNIREPGPKPAGSTWIEIRPKQLGNNRRIYHKLDKGFVDLQLDGSSAQVEKIKSNILHLLGTDTQVVVTGKSASVRVHVPLLDPWANFDQKLFEARAGMRATFRLIFFSRAIIEA